MADGARAAQLPFRHAGAADATGAAIAADSAAASPADVALAAALAAEADLAVGAAPAVAGRAGDDAASLLAGLALGAVAVVAAPTANSVFALHEARIALARAGDAIRVLAACEAGRPAHAAGGVAVPRIAGIPVAAPLRTTLRGAGADSLPAFLTRLAAADALPPVAAFALAAVGVRAAVAVGDAAPVAVFFAVSTEADAVFADGAAAAVGRVAAIGRRDAPFVAAFLAAFAPAAAALASGVAATGFAALLVALPAETAASSGAHALVVPTVGRVAAPLGRGGDRDEAGEGATHEGGQGGTAGWRGRKSAGEAVEAAVVHVRDPFGAHDSPARRRSESVQVATLGAA